MENFITDCIDKYGNDLFNFCLHLTGDRQDAEDLYQETFIVFIEKQNKVYADGNIKSFLFSISINLWKNQWRKKWRVFKRTKKEFSIDNPTEEGTELSELIASKDMNPEEELIVKEDIKKIRGAVENLPMKLKTIILMFYGADMTMEDIGKTLDIPVGTVKSRIHSAKKRLKKTLSELDSKGDKDENS